MILTDQIAIEAVLVLSDIDKPFVRIKDNTDYQDLGINPSQVVGIFKIAFGKDVIYSNPTYLVPDIKLATQTEVEIPLCCDKDKWCGDLEITYTILINRTTERYNHFTFPFCFEKYKIKLTHELNCTLGKLTSIDLTNYDSCKAYYVSDKYLHKLYSKNHSAQSVNNTQVFITDQELVSYKDCYTTEVTSVKTYDFENGLKVQYSAKGKRNFDVACYNLCCLECCVSELYAEYMKKCTLCPPFPHDFEWAMALLEVAKLMQDCNRPLANDIIQELAKLIDCEAKAGANVLPTTTTTTTTTTSTTTTTTTTTTSTTSTTTTTTTTTTQPPPQLNANIFISEWNGIWKWDSLTLQTTQIYNRPNNYVLDLALYQGQIYMTGWQPSNANRSFLSRLSLTSGQESMINDNIGVFGANALTILPDGRAYIAGSGVVLYEINLGDGSVSAVGQLPNPYTRFSGDMVYNQTTNELFFTVESAVTNALIAFKLDGTDAIRIINNNLPFPAIGLCLYNGQLLITSQAGQTYLLDKETGALIVSQPISFTEVTQAGKNISGTSQNENIIIV